MALLIGYGAGAINPYLAFESIEDLIAEDMHGLGGMDPKQGGQELHQGVRQGRAEDHVQDGRVDGGVATPAPRSSRRSVSASRWSTPTSPARCRTRWHRPRRDRRRGRGPPRDGESRRGPRSAPTASSSSAASTSGGARVSCTSSTPRRCSSCSTPPGRSATTSSRSTPLAVDDQSEKLMTLRGLFEFAGDREPVPIDEVEPVERDRQAVLDRRDELRLDLRRGPRDAGDRDEPSSARSRTPARVARTSTGCTTRSGARRSSRSRPDASG